MSDARSVKPARVGILIDYVEGDGYDPNIVPTLQLVVDEYLESGVLDRPIEFVVRAVQGLPNGAFRAVRDAFDELVAEDCVVIYGPQVSENGEPLREYVEALGQVACISMAGTESMLGEWVFALNNGSMEDEPIVMAAVAKHDGCRTVGIAYETSLIGQEYARAMRLACRRYDLQIVGEVAIPQVASEHVHAMGELATARPDAVMHVGFGLGLLGMNAAFESLGWMPKRYTTTAFEFAANNDMWLGQLAGWVGLDQYDERNETAQAFLDRFEARYGRRPEYYFPVYCYDMGRVIVEAIASARPLTGRGIKEALERVKLLPAACGAPGTMVRFGRFIRQGWFGGEYLVARRVLDDGSRHVMHGTIAGLVNPAGDQDA